MKAMERELCVRRLTVEEALLKLDQYINYAFMAGLPSVRVVHGKGMGKLRRAVHDLLGRHPLVISYRLGDHGEGDYGVTVVELSSR